MGQDRPRQVGTGRDRSGQVGTGEDRSGQVGTDKERSGQVRTGQDNVRRGQTGCLFLRKPMSFVRRNKKTNSKHLVRMLRGAIAKKTRKFWKLGKKKVAQQKYSESNLKVILWSLSSFLVVYN